MTLAIDLVKIFLTQVTTNVSKLQDFQGAAALAKIKKSSKTTFGALQ